MLSQNQIIEIKIERMAYGAKGIGKYNGMTILVDRSIPGDFIQARVIKVKKNYALAQPVKYLKSSSYRTESPCLVNNQCGGCQWIDVQYEAQLNFKMQFIQDSFQKIAGINPQLQPIIRNPNRVHFRHKLQFPVQSNNCNGLSIGYFQSATHQVVETLSCPNHPPILNVILNDIIIRANQHRITGYDHFSHQGVLRHIVFQCSLDSREVLLTLVINSKKLDNNLMALIKDVKKTFSQIRGILVNHNVKQTSQILGNKSTLLSGYDYIVEKLGEKEFRISAGSFFQVNPYVARKMFETIFSLVQENYNMPSILDVYAGVGSFSIWLYDIIDHSTAIEQNPSSYQDASFNFKQIDDQNKLRVLCGKAEALLEKLAREKKQYDCILLDPPRIGCKEMVLENAAKLTKKGIIYISCDPNTLARDIAFLIKKGFDLKKIIPVDMFTHTFHVETIAYLEK